MSDAQPVISLIWAMAENRVVGRDQGLPWHLPGDFHHFKSLTLGKPILMGRRTWESLPGLLPDRTHYVLTRDPHYQAAGCVVVHSVDEALRQMDDAPEIMVIGGAQLYAQMLPLAHRLYLTLVHTEIKGDTHFPVLDLDRWREVSREHHPADDENPFAYSFIDYESKR